MRAQLPRACVIIGGGAIGCEFASTLSDLGTQVTLLEALPKILPGCDEDITKEVLRSFKKRKIDVRTGVAVTGHTPGGAGTTVHFGDGESIEVEARDEVSDSVRLKGRSDQRITIGMRAASKVRVSASDASSRG